MGAIVAICNSAEGVSIHAQWRPVMTALENARLTQRFTNHNQSLEHFGSDRESGKTYPGIDVE